MSTNYYGSTVGMNQGGYGYSTGMQSGFPAGVPAGGQGAFGPQAIFQPGFAGTDVQRVRNQIARDGGFGYGGTYQTGYGAGFPLDGSQGNWGFASGAQGTYPIGIPAGFPYSPVNVQSIFQPGFAGTDVQRVRNQIARDGGFGYGGTSQVGFTSGVPGGVGFSTGMQSGFPAGVPAGVQGAFGPQAIFQPGFAGTDVQRVRNQIARDGGFGYGGTQSGYGMQGGFGSAVGMQSSYLPMQNYGYGSF